MYQIQKLVHRAVRGHLGMVFASSIHQCGFSERCRLSCQVSVGLGSLVEFRGHLGLGRLKLWADEG